MANEAKVVAMSEELVNFGAHVFDNGQLRIEYDNYYVACYGTGISLNRTEFLFVSRLSEPLGAFVSAKELWAFVNGENADFNLYSFRVSMSRLRQKLRPFGVTIQCIPLKGYCLDMQ